MRYTVAPELPGLLIKDQEPDDQPRAKESFPDTLSTEEATALALIGGISGPTAASVGIIGGSDGPTALLLGGNCRNNRFANSAMRFEPAERICWKAVFPFKEMGDISVDLLE
jgi:hypothetical protein